MTKRHILLLLVALVACAQTPIVIPEPPASPAQRREISDVFPLDPTIPATQITLTVTLSKTPATDTLLDFRFQSSQLGGAFTSKRTPIGPNTRQVIITLPKYRPFTGLDIVTISYWTTEP